MASINGKRGSVAQFSDSQTKQLLNFVEEVWDETGETVFLTRNPDDSNVKTII